MFTYNTFCVSHNMFSVSQYFSVTHHMLKRRKTVPIHQLLGFSHGLILGSLFFGLASGWKVRSREFTLPFVARCAMGFCKRGCADAWVEFFLARYLWGLRLESEVARIYVATCCSPLCVLGIIGPMSWKRYGI